MRIVLLIDKGAIYYQGRVLVHVPDMVKDCITRTRASIKGAVQKARDTAGRDLVV